MVVIAILAIPFVFFFVRTPDYGAMRQGDFARLYDRNVSILEAQQVARLFGLAQALGMSDFVQTLTAGAGLDPNQVAAQFVINLLVLRHEAERLGLRPSSAEIAQVVRTLPAFQGESGFDMNKFNNFVQNALGPSGLAEEHIEQLVRDEMCLNRIKQLLAAGVAIPKGELEENFQRGYDRLFVSVIRFRPADFDKDIAVSDEDVKKYYEAHKDQLKSEEKRKVEFVRLALTEEEKKLTGGERIEALQKLSDKATDFTQALLEKGADFRQTAAKFQLQVGATGEFTAAAPDPQLKENPQLGAAAFKLSLQEPNSDPIQVADGYYILHLAGVVEARPLTLDEAKPKIVEAIKRSKARERMSTNAADLVKQLREAAASGQSLEAAAQKAGAKLEKIPPFSLIDDSAQAGQKQASEKQAGEKETKDKPADLETIKQAVAFLRPGEVSDFFPAGESGFIAILEKREPSPETNTAQKKKEFEERLLDNKRRIVFYEWLHERVEAAGLRKG